MQAIDIDDEERYQPGLPEYDLKEEINSHFLHLNQIKREKLLQKMEIQSRKLLDEKLKQQQIEEYENSLTLTQLLNQRLSEQEEVLTNRKKIQNNALYWTECQLGEINRIQIEFESLRGSSDKKKSKYLLRSDNVELIVKDLKIDLKKYIHREPLSFDPKDPKTISEDYDLVLMEKLQKIAEMNKQSKQTNLLNSDLLNQYLPKSRQLGLADEPSDDETVLQISDDDDSELPSSSWSCTIS
jgi:hypothetical protein